MKRAVKCTESSGRVGISPGTCWCSGTPKGAEVGPSWGRTPGPARVPGPTPPPAPRMLLLVPAMRSLNGTINEWYWRFGEADTETGLIRVPTRPCGW